MRLKKWLTYAAMAATALTAAGLCLRGRADSALAADCAVWMTIAALLCAGLSFVLEAVPLSVTALLIPVYLTLTGVLTSAEAFRSFSDSTILIYAGMFVIGGAMFSTGLARAIGDRVIALSRGSERGLCLGVMLVTILLSSTLSNTGTVAVLLPVAISICDSAGWSRQRLLLPLAMAASSGGMITLVGTPPNITVNGVLEQMGGRHFGFFEFAAVGIPMSLVTILYFLTLGRKLLPEQAAPSGQAAQAPAAPGGCRSKQWLAGGILLLVVLCMATELVPLHVAAVAGGILCILTGVIGEKEAYHAIDLSTLFLFAGALSLSVALEKTGAGAVIAHWVIGLLDGRLTPYLLLTVVFLLTALLTQFMSNTACAALLAPIGVQIALQLGVPPQPVLMTVAVAASAAYATPVATPPNTMVAGPADLRFGSFAKVGLPLLVLAYGVAMLIIPLIWPL